MNLTFGKHEGKSLELVILKYPDYIDWMLQQENTYGAMRDAQEAARRLIEIFDSKPFTENCYHKGCTNQVTRCSVYRGAVDNPYWWCDEHKIYESGGNPDKLTSISTYIDALNYSRYSSASRSECRSIIKDLARAKGLSSRVGENQAQHFFA